MDAPFAPLVSRNGISTMTQCIARVAPNGSQPWTPRLRRRCRCMLARMKIVVRWLLLAAALLLVANISPGVTVSSFGSALIAALVLGLFNTLLRPVLVLLTLPVTLLTLGLFLFVINALMFFFAASVLEGFNVSGFGAALLGSLIYSLCGMVIDVAVERLFGAD